MAVQLKNSRSGFTLIELMIVIMIIGILGGILVPAVNNALKKAKAGTAKTLLMKFKSGIAEYRGDTNQYPTTLKDLLKRPKSGDEKVTKKWNGPYGFEEGTEDVPEDPWGERFVYKVTPQPAKHPYELYSHGPNGKGSPKEERIDVWD